VITFSHPFNSVEEHLARFIDPDPFSSDDEEDEGENVGEELNDTPSENVEGTEEIETTEPELAPESKNAKDDANLTSAEASLRELLELP